MEGSRKDSIGMGADMAQIRSYHHKHFKVRYNQV